MKVKKGNSEQEYTIKYFKIRSPAEHTIDDLASDLEIQFVHQRGDDDQDILIISALFDTDSTKWKATADFFDSFKFDKWDGWIEDGKTDELKVNIGKFIDKYEDKSHWRYFGSMTEPPCEEVVQWIVMQEVQWINPNDLSYLQKVL